MMQHLSHSDCEKLLALTSQLYLLQDAAHLPQLLLSSLRPLIRHEFGGCHLIQPSAREIEPCYDPARPPLPAMHRDFWRLSATHPLNPVLFSPPSRAWKLSDVISRRAFHQTEFYNVLYRPLRVDCELTAVLTGQSKAFFLISLHRYRLDFDERDRALLNLLLPHVAAVRRRLAAHGASRNGNCCWFSDEPTFYEWLRGHTTWGLTQRESDVLFWLYQGKTNGEIGRILGIAERTAETHALRLYPKMGVENRYTAIATLNHLAAMGRH